MLKEIFVTFFKIGLFTLGGGYSMIPVIQKEVVEDKKWISQEEFLDALAITNSLPGPLATNSATYVGYRIAGPIGSLTAVFATALPSFLIILVIAIFFASIRDNIIVQNIFSGIRPAIAGLMLYAVTNLSKFLGFKIFNIAIAVGAFIAIAFLNIHPFLTILISGTLGFIKFRKEKNK